MEWQDPPFGCHLAIIGQLGPQCRCCWSAHVGGSEASIRRPGMGCWLEAQSKRVSIGGVMTMKLAKFICSGKLLCSGSLK